jgi:hypothetical protein
MVDRPDKWLTHDSSAGRLGIDSLPKWYEMFSAVFQKKIYYMTSQKKARVFSSTSFEFSLRCNQVSQTCSSSRP